MEIRPMKLKDIVQVRDLEISCIKEYFAEILENKWESLPQQWKDDLGASSKKSFGIYLESGLSFVAEEDGEIFGFIFAQMLHHVNNTENLVWIENMGVHPYLRRNGIGYKLLRATMDAGIEKINPTMVVIRAIEIPFANSDGFGVLAELAITEKDATIPSTVPSNPTDGATAAIKPT